VITASDTNVFEFNAQQTKELRKNYNLAYEANETTFKWNGISWLMCETTYLLKFLERKHGLGEFARCD
jgi:hypothetical protein